MNKTRILLITVLFLVVTGTVRSEEGELSGVFDLTYMSKLMDKGGEFYGQQGGILESINLDLWGTGFGVSVGHRQATAAGYVNGERIDYVVHYGNQIFGDDDTYRTDYKVGYVYHQSPDQPRNVGNAFEGVVSLSWCNLLPAGICPFYTVAYETPAGSGYGNRAGAGWWHQFGFDCGIKLPGLPGLPGIGSSPEEQTYRLSADVAYRDGLGGSDHDWSHATFGLSTVYEIAEGLAFIPGVYHQISMDDSVCTNDVTYAVLSVQQKF
jgi:hypothetical protein